MTLKVGCCTSDNFYEELYTLTESQTNNIKMDQKRIQNGLSLLQIIVSYWTVLDILHEVEGPLTIQSDAPFYWKF